MAKRHIPYKDIGLAAAALGLVAFAMLYLNFNRSADTMTEDAIATDYSIQGIVKEIKDLRITVVTPNLEKDGFISEYKEEKIYLGQNTQYFFVDPSTTPFIISAATINDIQPGNEVVIYSVSNPSKRAPVSAYKIDILK